MKVRLNLLAVIILLVISGCGDSDDRTFFVGNVTVPAGTRANVFSAVLDNVSNLGKGDLDGLKICSSLSCDIVSPDGSYGLNIPQIAGGDVLFSFTAKNFQNNIVVTNLPSGESFFNIDFNIRPSGDIDFTLDLGNIPPPVIITPDISGTPESTPTFPAPVGTFEPTPGIAEPTATSAPSEVEACTGLSGTYIGSGGCQLGSFTATGNTGNVSLSPFGSNGAQSFNLIDDRSGISVSSDLILFGKKGHSCRIQCDNKASLVVSCSNPAGGSCAENFSK